MNSIWCRWEAKIIQNHHKQAIDDFWLLSAKFRKFLTRIKLSFKFSFSISILNCFNYHLRGASDSWEWLKGAGKSSATELGGGLYNHGLFSFNEITQKLNSESFSSLGKSSRWTLNLIKIETFCTESLSPTPSRWSRRNETKSSSELPSRTIQIEIKLIVLIIAFN